MKERKKKKSLTDNNELGKERVKGRRPLSGVAWPLNDCIGRGKTWSLGGWEFIMGIGDMGKGGV